LNTKYFRFFFHKIFNWEYWPQALVYAPIIPVYLYYACKARSLFFGVAANPDMENGGYIMESKFAIYKQLPQSLVPKTICIAVAKNFEEVRKQLEASGIGYPFFCKPDIGGKGRGVSKIENENQLQQYNKKAGLVYLIQQEIPYKNEIGIFYCRLPDASAGFITGIAGKKNMEVTGNGTNTLQQLIEAVPRYYFQRSYLFKKYASKLLTILPDGKKIILSEVGNHARGSTFADLTYCNNVKLEALIDRVSKTYNTFYFGRYDIKFNSWEDLYAGKNFMLVELNGCGSEPIHIYDPNKKIWQAWKIIMQHWKLMYTIAAQHHKKSVPYLSLRQIRELQRQEKEIIRKTARMQEC
jgi:ATP-grasp domain